MAPATWEERCKEHRRKTLVKKGPDGRLLYSSIAARWEADERCRQNISDLLERPSALEDAESMDEVALQTKAAAKAAPMRGSERLEAWRGYGHVWTQNVRRGESGGGSGTTRLRGTTDHRTAVDALKGSKGKGNYKE